MSTELNKHDLNFSLRRLPYKVRKLMEDPIWSKEIMAGGGFIRSVVAGESINDVDLFATSYSNAWDFAVALLNAHDPKKFAEKQAAGGDEFEKFKKRNIYTTENAYTLRCYNPTVQIIHRWTFSSVEQIIKSFDFTICCAAIAFNGKKWESAIHPRFYEDLAAKRLVYLSPVREEEPGGSMLRVLKYYQKGFRMPLDSLGAVIARLAVGAKDKGIRRLVEKNVAETEEQATARVITGLLRVVDPLIDLTHEAHLPSETESEASNTALPNE